MYFRNVLWLSYIIQVSQYNIIFLIVLIIHKTTYPESLRILQFNFLLNHIPWSYIKTIENMEVLPGDYYYYILSDN